MEKLKVVVIGSGIGGSGVATLLQHAGCDVTVLEKNPYLGGKCHTFEKDGFVVDAGVHMISRGPNGPLMLINNMVKGDLQWVSRRHIITFQVGNKYMLPYRQSVFDPIMLPKWGWGFMQATRDGCPGETATRNGSALRITKMFNSLHKITKQHGGFTWLMSEVFKLLSMNEVYYSDLDEMTVKEFVDGFTDNFPAHQLAAYASMIILVVPYTVGSAGELLWCAVRQMAGASVSVPLGGARAIPAAYLDAMVSDGGKLELGAEAKKILVDSGKVKGVKTADGREFEADIVISNAGIKLTCAMAGKANFPKDYIKRVDGLRYSCSYITKKYGLSKKSVDVNSAGFFHVANVEPETMFDYLDTGEAPADPQLFTTIPTEVDFTAGKPGEQLVIMGVPGPITGSKESSKHCDKILAAGEERLFEVFPDIEKNTRWTVKTDTHYYAKMTGKPTGDCIGLGQYVGQTGIHKPSAKTPVEGLYLVGTDAGARGVGTEQAAESAIRVAKLIESKYAIKK
ncbi:MAG: NAD(P)/FAD-dependent oxidoreductase [Actinobacteria bacterium]|nr:NAD(P)/FAD-dependent oxidoreductase [Actinomycetota bacterium]